MSKEIRSCLGCITCIVITHTLVTVVTESAAGISVVLIFLIEEIVDRASYSDRLQ